MGDVTLNGAVRSNLRTMQSTTDLLTRTQERLSTGKKVNSAFDNPGSYFTAQALDRRASELTGLLDNVSNSVKTLEAADNGLSAINEVVEGLKATARSALQSPTAVATKANVESGSLTGLSASNLLGSGGGDTAAETNFTGVGFTFVDTPGDSISFDVSVDGGPTTSVAITYAEVTAAFGRDYINGASELSQLLNAELSGLGLTATATSGTAINLKTNSTGSSSSIAITNYAFNNAHGDPDETGLGNRSVSGSGASPVAGKTLSVTDRSGATKTVTFAANGVNTLDELNDWLKANDVALTASVTTTGNSGKLKLETTNASANETPADIGGTITGTGGAFAADKTFSAPVLDAAGAARRSAFVRDYNDALKQISSLAKDASFNGVNLLDGDDLDIVFNEDGDSKLGVKGVRFDAAGLGLDALADADFYDGDSINDVLDVVDAAFGKLETQSSKFGSQLQIVQTRESFTKDTVSTLNNGALALVGADTDEEAANLATLQTRQQLIVSSLSISTSQESNVLQLLR